MAQLQERARWSSYTNSAAGFRSSGLWRIRGRTTPWTVMRWTLVVALAAFVLFLLASFVETLLAR